MAMKKIVLNGIGAKGINTDISPWVLEAEYITDGVNFKIDGDSIISSGGHNSWSTPGTSFNAGYLRHVSATGGNYWLVAGRSAVYAFDGAIWTDISSTAGYAGIGADDELNWTGCSLGSIPVISNPQGAPEYWSPQSPGQVMQPLQFDSGNTWAAKGYSFQVIRSHKNYLFALNLQEGLSELPNSYRWSHPADNNALPFTWDETDNSGLAGKAQLGGNTGAIIDGLSLKDSFVIYSENAINVLDPSNDEFVWRRRELSSTIGLVSKQTIIEVKGKHYFMGDGDIYVTNGNSIDSIIHNRIKNRFNATINADYFHTSYVTKDVAKKEIWFCVPTEDAIYPNTAYIYNWRDDSWAIRQLPYETTTHPTTGVVTVDRAIAYAAYGPQTDASTTWDTWVGDWDNQTQVWGTQRNTPGDNTLVGIDFADSSLIFLDPPNLASGDIGTVLERTDFPLGEHPGVTTTSRVYPHIEGTATLSIQLGSQGLAGGPVRWKPAVTFTPGVDRKIDVRTTGELLCWRITSVGSGNFRFSGMTIEYTPAGYR